MLRSTAAHVVTVKNPYREAWTDLEVLHIAKYALPDHVEGLHPPRVVVLQ